METWNIIASFNVLYKDIPDLHVDLCMAYMSILIYFYTTIIILDEPFITNH